MRYSNLFYKPHPPLRGPPSPKGKVYSLNVLDTSASLRSPEWKVKCYAFSVSLSRLSYPLTFLGGRRAPALRVCAEHHLDFSIQCLYKAHHSYLKRERGRNCRAGGLSPAVSSSSKTSISLPHRGRGTTKWWKESLTPHIIMNHFKVLQVTTSYNA